MASSRTGRRWKRSSSTPTSRAWRRSGCEWRMSSRRRRASSSRSKPPRHFTDPRAAVRERRILAHCRLGAGEDAFVRQREVEGPAVRLRHVPGAVQIGFEPIALWIRGIDGPGVAVVDGRDFGDALAVQPRADLAQLVELLDVKRHLEHHVGPLAGSLPLTSTTW